VIGSPVELDLLGRNLGRLEVLLGQGLGVEDLRRRARSISCLESATKGLRAVGDQGSPRPRPPRLDCGLRLGRSSNSAESTAPPAAAAACAPPARELDRIRGVGGRDGTLDDGRARPGAGGHREHRAAVRDVELEARRVLRSTTTRVIGSGVVWNWPPHLAHQARVDAEQVLPARG